MQAMQAKVQVDVVVSGNRARLFALRALVRVNLLDPARERAQRWWLKAGDGPRAL